MEKERYQIYINIYQTTGKCHSITNGIHVKLTDLHTRVMYKGSRKGSVVLEYREKYRNCTINTHNTKNIFIFFKNRYDWGKHHINTDYYK